MTTVKVTIAKVIINPKARKVIQQAIKSTPKVQVKYMTTVKAITAKVVTCQKDTLKVGKNFGYGNSIITMYKNGK